MVKKWVPLESNPDVLTTFASKIGLDVSGHSFTDVYGLDDDLLAMVPQPVVSVFLLYPITEETEAAAKAADASMDVIVPPGMFYMKQTINNACGTIALLHSIGNNADKLKIDEGSFLDRFFHATKGMSPEQAGHFLEDPPEGAPDVEEAHQAAAIAGETAAPSAEEDVDLHFVSFVHKDGHLYELDGRRKCPVDHGATSEETFLHDVAKVVKAFMEKSNSLNFNLMALTEI